MDSSVIADDRFMLAWGEAEAWRGYEARSRLLASMSTALISSAPVEIFQIAHALGNAHALRHHLIHEIDALLPHVRSPYLHKGLREARTSRRGPARWRKYWLSRVLTYGSEIEGELNAVVSAQTRLAAWSRALSVAQEGLMAARARAPSPPPVQLCRDWDALSLRLEEEGATLTRLDERISKLIEGLGALRAKGEGLLEVIDTVPSNEDVLRAMSLQHLLRDLDKLPPSHIPGALE